MMKSIVDENLVSFKVLENYDKELAQSYNKQCYRGKGKLRFRLDGCMYVTRNHSNLFVLQYFNKKDLQSMGLNTLVLDTGLISVNTTACLSSGSGARGLGDLCFARTEVKRRPMRSKLFYEIRKLKKLPMNT